MQQLCYDFGSMHQASGGAAASNTAACGKEKIHVASPVDSVALDGPGDALLNGDNKAAKGCVVVQTKPADELTFRFFGRVVERSTALNMPRHYTVEVPVEWYVNGETRTSDLRQISLTHAGFHIFIFCFQNRWIMVLPFCIVSHGFASFCKTQNEGFCQQFQYI